jgi:hypothetical protein
VQSFMVPRENQQSRTVHPDGWMDGWMDGKWSRNNFQLGFSALANHGS